MVASRLANIPELLDLLGLQIESRGLLYRLCLVSRVFNTVFTSHLYKRLSWGDRNITCLGDEEKQKLLLNSGNLMYAQVFMVLDTAISCRMKIWETSHPQDQQDWNFWHYFGQEFVYREVCDSITKFLPSLKKIKSFRSCGLAISVECMMALSASSSLRNVSIGFPRDYDGFIGLELDSHILHIENEQRLASFANPLPEFKFSGLVELSLYNLWGDIGSWRQQILQVMSNSPGLEHLSLSIAEDTAERLDMVNTEEDEEDWRFYTDMFQWLCREYTAKRGRPLKLKSVWLGYGIRFHDLTSIQSDFDPSILESVHIHNLCSDPPIYSVPWDLLLPANSPKLQFISFFEMSEEGLESIRENLARRITIGIRGGAYDLDDSDGYTAFIYGCVS